MKFLRALLAKIWRVLNSIRIVLLNIIFFSLLIMVIAMMSQGEEMPNVPEDGLLVLNLEGALVEEETYVDPFERFFQEAFSSGVVVPETHLYQLLTALDEATNDDRIGGIVLDLRHFTGGGLNKMMLVGDKLT